MKVALKTHIVCIFVISVFFACRTFAHDETAKLFPSDANASDSFGISVAIDGNIAIVGAYLNDSRGTDCGAAYVYEFSGSQWIQKQKLVPSDGSAGDKFGRSVAIEGNTIVVGSYYDDNKGSAYVFSRLGGVWIQRQKIVAPDTATGDKFGCSVAIDNNTIVVGAYGDDSYAGSASVFVLADPNWVFQQKTYRFRCPINWTISDMVLQSTTTQLLSVRQMMTIPVTSTLVPPICISGRTQRGSNKIFFGHPIAARLTTSDIPLP